MQRILRARFRGFACKGEPRLVGALGLDAAEGRDGSADHDAVHSGDNREEGKQANKDGPTRHHPRCAATRARLNGHRGSPHGPRKKSAVVAWRWVAVSITRKIN